MPLLRLRILANAVLVVALVLLGGCAAWYDRKDAVAKRYRDANSSLSNDAEVWLCRGMSVYEWTQRYGSSAEKAEAWRTLCGDVIEEVPHGSL